MAVPTVDPSYRPLCWLPADLITQKMKQRPHCSQTVHCFRLLFSQPVMSNSLWPHGLQHARLPCPSTTPRACWNSCPSSWWCHPTTSSSVTLFSSCPQSLPASEFFPMSWPFASGSQSIGASASASVLPMNIQGWFPLGLTGLTCLLSKGFSKSVLQHNS